MLGVLLRGSSSRRIPVSSQTLFANVIDLLSMVLGRESSSTERKPGWFWSTQGMRITVDAGSSKDFAEWSSGSTGFE